MILTITIRQIRLSFSYGIASQYIHQCVGPIMLSSDGEHKPIGTVVATAGFISSVAGIALVSPFPGQFLLLYGLGAAFTAAGAVTLVRVMRRMPPLKVRGHLGSPEFDVSFALGQRIYAKHLKRPYPSREQAEGWLRNYSSGVFQAYDHNDKCWGYFSMWPLRQEAFQAIKNGEATEADLVQSMIASTEDAPFTYWYIADILKDNCRFHVNISSPNLSEYICHLMIHSAFSSLLREGQLAFPIEIVGCAVSQPGEKWLKRFHFQHALTPAEEKRIHKVYIRTITRPTLLSQLRRMRRMLSGQEAEIRRLMKKQ